jgi:hypothetical protein
MVANGAGGGAGAGGQNPQGSGAAASPQEIRVRARHVRHGLMAVLARILDNAIEEYERLKYFDDVDGQPYIFPPLSEPAQSGIPAFFKKSLDDAKIRAATASELIKALVDDPPGGGDGGADDP